jgi:DNA-binding NarL/FixJ family response regulator
VLLADDHSAFLERTTALLNPQFEIVGAVADGATLISEALRLRPDVIVADISMPGLSGIDAAHRLRELASTARIVFLTIHSEPQFVEACTAEGGLGYVVKSQMRAHLIPAVYAALIGAAYVSPLVPK